MSESAPPGLANDAPVGPAPALTPQAIAAVLADFQSWLTTAAQAAPADTALQAGDEPVDLHTLVGQFIALRHEVNLQTRATRVQQEQNAETLRQLTEALAALERLQNATPQAAESDDTSALLKTLIDVHDALTVGGREIGKVQTAVAPLLRQIADLSTPYPIDVALLRAPPPSSTPRSGWSRWFGGGGGAETAPDKTTARLAATLGAISVQQQERAQKIQEPLGRLEQMIASLAAGYTMSLQRIERALQKHGLEPMAVVGTQFDPEQMEVLDVVLNSAHASGEVVEEVRRGYLWEGRVFRYAQVRVAKG